MPNAKPKYSIREHLKKSPKPYCKIQYEMCAYCEITHRTLEKYTNLPSDSKKSMSSDLFFKMVQFLKIKQSELLNQ